MLNYEELAEKSKNLNQLIDENLEKQKILQTKELVSKSNSEYQRQAYIRKLREKLNLVINSRNKANDSNKRLLSDFDRIQKHLALMDSKTEVLMNNVDSQKRYLDIHYPKWRERANMFTSPSYLNQENLFNLLDSLRCRLKDDGNSSFRTFPKQELNFNKNQSLVSLLKTDNDGAKLDSMTKNVDDDTNQTNGDHKNQATADGQEASRAQYLPRNHGKKSSFTNFYAASETIENDDVNALPVYEKPKYEPTIDTLTNITVSPDVSLNLKGLDTNVDDEEEIDTTDVTLSPKHSQETSLNTKTTSPEPDPLSFVKPVPATNIPTYNFQSTAVDNIDVSDSNEDIENMLSPQKPAKPQSPKSPSPERHSPTPQDHFSRLSPRDRNPSLDSPGGSVDTIIKSPIAIHRNKKAPKLSILASQVSLDSESESSSAFKPVVSMGKKKTALDLLNESSESEVVLQNENAADSEDDFDFFD